MNRLIGIRPRAYSRRILQSEKVATPWARFSRPDVATFRERLKRFPLLDDLQRAFRMRSYLVGLRVRSLRRRVVDGRAMANYVEAQTVRKLQLGTGPNLLPGWLNTDLLPDTYPEHRHQIVFLDATKPFPLDSMTFDYVFSEHQIEHVTEPDARSMVKECFRILRPGGRVRIATPDLSAILTLYEDPLDEAKRHYIDWVLGRFLPNVRAGNKRCYVINQMFMAYKHRFIYDQETLAAILTDAGFVDVVRREPGESEDPVLQGVEGHGRAIGDEEVNRFETLVVEAVRPSEGGAP
jgi:predicted SAM-dependent methyltransferase